MRQWGRIEATKKRKEKEKKKKEKRSFLSPCFVVS